MLCVQEYGSSPAAFHHDEEQVPVFSLRVHSEEQQVRRLLLERLSKSLKDRKAYDGSKIALMEKYGVSLSVVASDVLLLSVEGLASPASTCVRSQSHAKPAKKPKKAAASRNKSARAAEKKSRGRKNARTTMHDEDVFGFDGDDGDGPCANDKDPIPGLTMALRVRRKKMYMDESSE